jgi:hypothetical protein
MGVKFYIPFSAFKGIFSTADTIAQSLRPMIVNANFRRMCKQKVAGYLIP